MTKPALSPARKPLLGGRRSYALLAGLAHFWLLYYVYVEKLRRWDYLGFALADVRSSTLFACLVLAVVPTLLMPIREAGVSTDPSTFT